MSIRIVLVEDHALVRSGIRLILENAPGIQVVREAGDGRQAVEACVELRPDVVLTDVEMPTLNGIEAAHQIHAAIPGVKIIMLSMHDDQAYVRASFSAGASGYLLKGAASSELLAAIEVVAAGGRYLSPGLNVAPAENRDTATRQLSKLQLDKLSAREQEVLQLIAEGCTNSQVGKVIHVSPRTVEFHRANIMQKLEIRTIAGLTKFAIQNGLTSLKQSR
jgi:DNA-binding NarL/FixJ family response regulator